MGVAAKLQAHARNRSNAYQLLRRLHAYEVTPDIGHDRNDVAVLAAIETALLECAQLGATEIVVGEAVPDNVLERMKPIESARFVRPDGVDEADGRRAYCTVGGAPDPTMREGDFAYDVIPAMDRFPRF